MEIKNPKELKIELDIPDIHSIEIQKKDIMRMIKNNMYNGLTFLDYITSNSIIDSGWVKTYEKIYPQIIKELRENGYSVEKRIMDNSYYTGILCFKKKNIRHDEYYRIGW